MRMRMDGGVYHENPHLTKREDEQHFWGMMEIVDTKNLFVGLLECRNENLM